MHTKSITFLGRPVVLACDGNCNKAWGMQNRPTVAKADSNRRWCLDAELGYAPDDPGTSEGGDVKPAGPRDMNKWCARECERSSLYGPNEEIILKSF